MNEPIKENYLISILYQMDGNTYVTLTPYFSKVIFIKHTFKYDDIIFDIKHFICYRYYQYYSNSYHQNKFMFYNHYKLFVIF